MLCFAKGANCNEFSGFEKKTVKKISNYQPGLTWVTSFYCRNLYSSFTFYSKFMMNLPDQAKLKKYGFPQFFLFENVFLRLYLKLQKNVMDFLAWYANKRVSYETLKNIICSSDKLSIFD